MTNKATEVCIHCGKEVTTNNIKRHEQACNGTKTKVNKIRGVDFDPNIGYKNGTRVAWNKGLTKDTDERVAKNTESLLKARQSMPLFGCAAWSTEERRSAAKKYGFGGYRPNAGRSKKFKVLDSLGNETTLQSSFEFRCSELLNEMGIIWVRPKALRYDSKNYFADFYLPDYDVWLDPKNDYKAKIDSEKISKVIEQNNIKLYVLLEQQITKEYIESLLLCS